MGSAAWLREIWDSAYEDLHNFRSEKLLVEVGKQSRDSLEELIDRLGNLQIELRFLMATSVEAGLLIPSLRVESFHRALYEVMEFPKRAQTLDGMFGRVQASVTSELTAIEIRERREVDERRRIEDERRLRRDAAAAAVLSLIVVPLTFLLSFFGVNTSEVGKEDSAFDMTRYWPVYTIALGLATVPVMAFAFLHGWGWIRSVFRSRLPDGRV